MRLRDRLLEPEGLFHGALFRDLLRAHFSTDGLQPEDRVGVYRIVREVGRGGMGVVYLAERADGEFDHSVALKWLSDALMSSESEVLFRRERQFLAELSHPNIARLIDGGHTEAGQLWFAMEYIEGLPIDRHAQAHTLDERARVELLLPVLEAVEFAHGRLLIHRDIKPGNVLIDTMGRAKLLDFGIAGLAQEAEHAQAFTPDYASPEQRALQPVGTASDVWQLGRLLEDVLRIEARREISRDLKAIIASATAEAPEQRYPTVTAFKHDLMRYLAHKPVHARRGGAGYRLRMLFRRHPFGATGTVLASLALIGLIAGFLWYAAAERVRLRRARDETEAINSFLTDDVLGSGNPFKKEGSITIPQVLERSIDGASRRFKGHPAIEGRVDLALARSLMPHGNFAAAAKAADRAIALLRQNGNADPRDLGEARLTRAQIDSSAGMPLVAHPKLVALGREFPFDGNPKSMFEWRIQAAIAWNDMLLSRGEDCTAVLSKLLANSKSVNAESRFESYSTLSDCQRQTLKLDAALASAREAEKLVLAANGAHDAITAISRFRVAFPLLLQGKHAQAIEIMEPNNAIIIGQLGENHGVSATYMNFLGNAYLCDNNNVRAALWLDRSVKSRRIAYGPEHAWTTGTEIQYLQSMIRIGRQDEVAPLAARLESIQNRYPNDKVMQAWLFSALGEWYLRQHRSEQAVSFFESARKATSTVKAAVQIDRHSVDAGLLLALIQANRTARAKEVITEYAASKGENLSCTSPLIVEADHLLADFAAHADAARTQTLPAAH